MTEQFGDHVDKYLTDKLAYYKDMIDNLSGYELSVSEVVDTLKIANGYIRLACGDDDELYSAYKYVCLFSDGKIFITNGEPPCTDPDREDP